MAPPPPPLNDDVTAEILLRLPPDEPEHLFRAALVCKPWLRIICDPDFRRTYHFPYPSDDGYLMLPLDCRHGRVLIYMLNGERGFLVWDPVTGHRHHLPHEPDEIEWLSYSAAVLCTTDGCDHLDCHGGPFRVVFAAMAKGTIMASVYSSDTGAWSVPVSLGERCIQILEVRRGALVADAVYFTLRWGNAIVRYDLRKDRLSMIDKPLPDLYKFALAATENNTSLSFASIQGSSLYTWSRKVDTGEDDAEWLPDMVIQLDRRMLANPKDEPMVVGFAEGVDVVFVSSGAGLFTIKLSSGQVKKVDEPGEDFSVLPYMSFYLPAMNETGNGGGHDTTDLPRSA